MDAATVQTAATIVLVGITGWYARVTARIADATRSGVDESVRPVILVTDAAKKNVHDEVFLDLVNAGVVALDITVEISSVGDEREVRVSKSVPALLSNQTLSVAAALAPGARALEVSTSCVDLQGQPHNRVQKLTLAGN